MWEKNYDLRLKKFCGYTFILFVAHNSTITLGLRIKEKQYDFFLSYVFVYICIYKRWDLEK